MTTAATLTDTKFLMVQQFKNNIPFFLFLLTLVFAPLAFGTVETWSIATVELLVACTAVLYFLQAGKSSSPILQVPGLLPLTLLIGWMCLQLLPLPPFIVQLIAPGVYKVYEPVLSFGNSSQWIPLTVMPKASLLELLRFSCYSIFYILTVQLLSVSTRLKKTVHWVVVLAISIAFLAIIQKFTSPDKIYWFRATPPNAGTVGPWVYHNHYAGFMEMLCPLALALFFYYRPTVRYQETLRARVAALFSMPSSNLHFFLGFGVILIVSSVFVALSRGGVISLSLALLLFIFLLSRKKAGSGILFVVVLSSILLAVSWFGWDPLLSKFGKAFTETGGLTNARLVLWQDSVGIIRDFFLTGSGFGTFVDVYPGYRTIPGTAIFDHAHNDYIELLTDGGLVGFVLAAWFVLTVLVHGIKKIFLRRDRYAVLVASGALTGIASILFHSVTDFNMHNGANGLYFFFTCGLLVAAGNTRLYYRTRPTLLAQAGEKKKYLFVSASILLLSATLLVHGGGLLATRSYEKVSSLYLSKHLATDKLHQVRSAIKQAGRYDPLNGFFPSVLGTVEFFLHNPEDALGRYRRAVFLNPLKGEYLQNLGLALAADFPEQSNTLLALAYERALNKDRLALTWAQWLLRAERREEAVAIMQAGARRYPKLVNEYLPLFMAYSFSRETIASILPDSVSVWIKLGRFMEKRNETAESEYYRSHALKFLDKEEQLNPWYFKQLYNFYRRHKQADKALSVLRQGIEWLPDYAPFHVYLGNYYRKEGVTYRAREEYEQALMLEPGNTEARQKLKKLTL